MNVISPEQLVSDFGGKSDCTRAGVRALHEAVFASKDGPGEESLDHWLGIFRKTCGRDWPRPRAKLDNLATFYGVQFDERRPAPVLFALHTWYVLLVKLLVGQVVAQARGTVSPVERLCSAIGPSVREEIERLESGDTFRDLRVTDPYCGRPFAWCSSAWSEVIRAAVVRLAERLRQLSPLPLAGEGPGVRAGAADSVTVNATCRDLLKPLYQSLFPRAVRHALGEYYTPDWLADHVLDQAGYEGQPAARLLDPTCGSGTFLMAAIRRLRERLAAEDHLYCRAILENIAGFDLHPLAVATARANYLMAIADLLPPDETIEIPVRERDAILGDPFVVPPSGGVPPEGGTTNGTIPPEGGTTNDYVVGNPPWIAWDNLPDDYRQATKPLWEQYGLFSLSGRDARHGGGKKDLSMLVLYVSADRYLRRGGRLGMVITQTLFQTKGAGDGFRRFRLGPDGDWLRVLRVDDLVAVRPFEDAANWTSTIVLEKGEPTRYPVQYVKWERALECGDLSPLCADVKDGNPEGTASPHSQSGDKSPHSKASFLARPIDPARPGSPWIVTPAGGALDFARCVGPSDYTGHLGANSGGANAVYWLELLGKADGGVRVRNLAARGKRGVEAVEAVVEPELLYPLVCWGDVGRYAARPSAYLLLVQDPATRTGLDEPVMRRAYPHALAYLRRFEPLLTARAAYRRYQDRQPFYSMYNVGPYTLAAFKVVWRRMDRQIRAAVLEPCDDPLLGPRPVVPQETCVLVACDSSAEAHYLCAMLNSARANAIVAAHSVAGGKGFGTPSILDFLPIRRFDAADSRHATLAALSRAAHRQPAAADEQRIHLLAAVLFDDGVAGA